MFVVRYLMAALAVLVAVPAWGIWAGYSAWTIVGLSLMAVLVLQAAIIAWVVVAASRRDRHPDARASAPSPARAAPDRLVVLPK